MNKTFAGFATVLLAIGLLSVPSPATADGVYSTTVNLGTAATYSVLGGTNITNSKGNSTLSGDLGLSPSGLITVTGSLIVGGTTYDKVTAAAQAQTDALAAYKDAESREGCKSIVADQIGLKHLAGCYYSAAAMAMTGDVTLNGGGNSDAVFIFNTPAALNTTAGIEVKLTNGAQASNVFWRTGAAVTMGANTKFVGTILSHAAVTMGAGSTLNGRALSITDAVTLDDNTFTGVTGTAAATTPGAPTSVSATAGDAQATVSWTAPGSDGGDAITGYTVTSSGGQTATTTGATSVVVSTLNNGTAYTFTVTASNGIGTSAASATSASVTPTAGSTAPGAPTIGAVTAGNAQATVAWTAPGSDGGDAITGYTVTASPGGRTATTTGATSVVVSTLNNGTTYTFTVTATNGIGTSAASATSASVTPTTGSTAPGAPTIGAITAGNAQATVAWTAPGSDGGDAITGYTVTASPGGRTATTTGATSVVVSTLTNGTAYTFTVTATNGIGTSAASATSASVTPTTGTTAPPVSAPPVSAPPVSAPPVSAPPVSAPPVSAPSAVVIDTPGQPTDTTTAGIANTPPTFLASLPPAGGATGSLNGRAAPLVVIDNKKAGRIKVSGENYEITIRPTSPSGGKLKLNSEGVGILKAGGKIASRGFGFLPSTKIDFYLIRGKVADFIGNLDVLADGTYDGAVPIRSSLSSGTYTLQVSGLTKQMKIRSVATLTRSVSVRVKIVETVKTVPTRYFSRGGKVYFKAYSSELSESAKRKLDTLVKKLPNKKSNLVRVTGLVGPGGSIGHVKALSKERAKTVARYLRAKDVRGKYVLKSGGNATGGSSSAQRAKVKITPIKEK